MDTEDLTIPELPSGPPDAYLELMFGAESGRRCPLDPVETLVGRGEEADFVLDDPTVSRRHARIYVEGRDYWLEELGSTNGTRVNGELVKKAKLSVGSTIELGGTILQMARGTVPAEAPPTGVLHRQETVRMPALSPTTPSRERPLTEETTDPEAIAARPRRLLPGLKRVTGSRSLTPSPLFAQFISWLVVLCIALGGVLLLLNILDTGLLENLGGDEEGSTAAISSPRQERAMPIVQPPTKTRKDDSALGDLPMDDAPDVALELFNEATLAEREGDLETAVDILRQISVKYPEFQPIGGASVVERVNALERSIAYAGTIKWGREVLADEASQGDRLQRLLTELSAIPANEPLYGDEAMALAEQTRQRLRTDSIHGTEAPEPVAVVTDVVVAPAEEADVVSESDLVTSDVDTGPTPDQLEEARAAMERAEQLYRRAAFKSAESRLLEVAETLPESDEKVRLFTMAKRLAEFERYYDQARNLSGKEAGSLARVEAMEKALAADARLPGKYVRELQTELAGELTRLATESLEMKRYDEARDFLGRARRHDRSARSVARLANLFAFRAAALFREAQKSTDPTVQRTNARDALKLAESGSTLSQEVAAFLANLNREDAP